MQQILRKECWPLKLELIMAVGKCPPNKVTWPGYAITAEVVKWILGQKHSTKALGEISVQAGIEIVQQYPWIL